MAGTPLLSLGLGEFVVTKGTDASIVMSVTGARQGRFRLPLGESPSPFEIPCLSLHVPQAPRDQGTGMATGKRLWKPLVVIREVDSASPLLVAAALTNEPLVVSIHAAGIGGGTGRPFTPFVLRGAAIESVGPAPGGSHHGILGNTDELERVEFSFERIEIDLSAGKTSFIDDWSGPGDE